jgi:hypothetical protein
MGCNMHKNITGKLKERKTFNRPRLSYQYVIKRGLKHMDVNM